jgi:hypothetical protein
LILNFSRRAVHLFCPPLESLFRRFFFCGVNLKAYDSATVPSNRQKVQKKGQREKRERRICFLCASPFPEPIVIVSPLAITVRKFMNVERDRKRKKERDREKNRKKGTSLLLLLSLCNGFPRLLHFKGQRCTE